MNNQTNIPSSRISYSHTPMADIRTQLPKVSNYSNMPTAPKHLSQKLLNIHL